MLISCDFQNIVIAFFLPYHTIFLGHFYLFLLIKKSIFGNKHLKKTPVLKLIETPVHMVYDFMHQRMILFVLYGHFHKFYANVAFPAIYAHFYQIGNIASIV